MNEYFGEFLGTIITGSKYTWKEFDPVVLTDVKYFVVNTLLGSLIRNSISTVADCFLLTDP